DDVPDGMKNAATENDKFFLYVPESWFEQTDARICGALSPLGEANVIADTYLSDTYYTPRSFWEQKCQKDCAAVLSDLTVVEAECKDTTMGSMNAYQVVFTHKVGDDTYKQLQVIAVDRNMVYTLQYTAKLADFDTNLEDVELIRANFQLR
ncbi:MAG: hypothetical protein J6U87_06410, partial [Clostridia bacterium]|nr:hypothetical protein [Clostridia bacterium]